MRRPRRAALLATPRQQPGRLARRQPGLRGAPWTPSRHARQTPGRGRACRRVASQRGVQGPPQARLPAQPQELARGQCPRPRGLRTVPSSRHRRSSSQVPCRPPRQRLRPPSRRRRPLRRRRTTGGGTPPSQWRSSQCSKHLLQMLLPERVSHGHGHPRVEAVPDHRAPPHQPLRQAALPSTRRARPCHPAASRGIGPSLGTRRSPASPCWTASSSWRTTGSWSARCRSSARAPPAVRVLRRLRARIVSLLELCVVLAVVACLQSADPCVRAVFAYCGWAFGGRACMKLRSRRSGVG
mmetsp:Transcript_97883/g.260011  ORF Transcript_97883/g.260011 Transcript_97883/m.260011 type:complete len:297 (+) Transcript_97883:1086-1976(+)